MADFGALFSTREWEVSGSDGTRLDHEIWFRTDQNKLKSKINGNIFTLADQNGPPSGAVFTVNYDPTETVYMSIQNPISFVP